MIKRISLPDAINILFVVMSIVTILAGALSNVFIDHEMIKKALWITLVGTIISALCCLYFFIKEKDRRYLLISLTFLVSVVINLMSMTKL